MRIYTPEDGMFCALLGFVSYQLPPCLEETLPQMKSFNFDALGNTGRIRTLNGKGANPYLSCEHPETEKKDALLSMLGDIFFFDNAYSEAVDCYRQVTSLEYRQKVFHNQLYSLFELKDYNGVLKTAAGYFKEQRWSNPKKG